MGGNPQKINCRGVTSIREGRVIGLFQSYVDDGIMKTSAMTKYHF